MGSPHTASGRHPGPEQLNDVYSAFSHARIPIVVIDREGLITDANATFADGYRAINPACIGANLFRDIERHPAIAPFSSGMAVVIKQVFQHRRPEFIREFMRGKLFWIDIYPISSPDGEVVKCCIVSQDTTVDHETQKKQKDRELQWDFASASCRLGLWRLDLKTGIFESTPENDRIFGYQPFTRKWDLPAVFESIVPEDRQWVEAHINGLFNTLADAQFECRIRRPDGETRWVAIVGKPQYDDSRLATHVYGFTQDITERKLLEERHTAEQLQWELTARQCRIGMWKLDLNTMIMQRNEEHARIYGEDYAARPFWRPHEDLEHVLAEDRDRVKALVDRCLRDKCDLAFDCRVYHTDGSIRWVHLTATFTYDSRGVPLHAIGTVRDVTEQKNIESKQLRLEEQLLQSQKMELIGQLAGGIAHDVNNVLAGIQGNVELSLLELDGGDPIRQHLETVINMVGRTAGMVRQLLAFARKQPTRPVEIGLDEELDRVRQMTQNLIRENITVTWALNCPGTKITVDPSSLIQIMTNLIVNARDAIAERGTIHIESGIICSRECVNPDCNRNDSGRCVKLTVSDTGAGIDQLVLPHIFEPYFTTKGVGKGSGLGLSTVYGLVKQSNGNITCSSEAGKGTTFTIYFPAGGCRVDQLVDALPFRPMERKHRNETILVVEDEHDITAIITTILAQEGFRVLQAASAEHALELADEHGKSICLVVTDVMLPGMNGVEMSRIIVQRRPGTKVLFMSGYSEEAIINDGSFDEGSDFIPKPFSIRQFIDKLNALL